MNFFSKNLSFSKYKKKFKQFVHFCEFSEGAIGNGKPQFMAIYFNKTFLIWKIFIRIFHHKNDYFWKNKKLPLKISPTHCRKETGKLLLQNQNMKQMSHGHMQLKPLVCLLNFR